MSDFVLSDAVELVRRKAAQAAAADDWPVDLAAHLFAIASKLAVDAGSARMMLRLPSPSGSLRVELRQLARLAPATDAQTLYSKAVYFLDLLDSELCRYPEETLAGLVELHLPGLRGTVLYWLRHGKDRPCLSGMRRRSYAVVGREPDDSMTIHPAEDLRRLALYWQSDDQLPRLELPRQLSRMNVPLVDESANDARNGRFRIALCPLDRDFHPRFEVDPGGQLFRARRPPHSMAGREALHAHLGALVAAARQEEIHLLVLPELTVDPQALEHLRHLLRSGGSRYPYGVVAGSFHVWPDGRPLPVNESVLLDQRGELLLRHRKRGYFRILKQHLEKLSHLFGPDLPPLAPKVREDIEYGATLSVLETSLGSLALLICADASERNPEHSFLNVVERLRPDLLIVISMSAETGPFEDLLESLQRSRIGTLYVNAHCLCHLTHAPDKKAVPLMAGFDLALCEPGRAAPTRFRWRYGGDSAECRYHRPADDADRDWRPSLAGLEQSLAFLWKKDGEPLGLVLDLGAYRGWFPEEQ